MTSRPAHLTLGDLIARLEQADPTRTVATGFANPHSYRGYYEDLAFEVTGPTTVQAMLDAARHALGATFQGYKGGDYRMADWTSVWLVQHEGECGESLGAVFLDHLLLATQDDLRAEITRLTLAKAGVEGERDAADDTARLIRHWLGVPDKDGWVNIVHARIQDGLTAIAAGVRVRAALGMDPTETDDTVIREIGIYSTRLEEAEARIGEHPRTMPNHPLALALSDMGADLDDPEAPGEIAAAVALLHNGRLARDLATLLRTARANAKELAKVMVGCAEQANAERASRQAWATEASICGICGAPQ